MMNTVIPTATRHSDVLLGNARPAAPALAAPQVLPPVDWSAMGAEAPRAIHTDARHAEDPLPQADIVVMTWTAAEWFALDHVFCNSGSAGDYSTDYEWKKAWWPYTRNVAPFSAGPDAAARRCRLRVRTRGQRYRRRERGKGYHDGSPRLVGARA